MRPNLEVDYTIFESLKPVRFSGLIDVSDLILGDEVVVSLLAGSDKDSIGLAREVLLKGPVKERWLVLDEKFFPAVKVVMRQTKGIDGRKFKAYWYTD